MSACCVVGCQFVGKITSRQPTVSCWLCENIAHAKCADFGHSAAQIADRTRSNGNLNWTCPTCLHIKIDIEANRAGVPGIPCWIYGLIKSI